MEKLKNLTKDYLLNNLLYVEIKTQDPYYLFGKFGAMAYPLKKSQVEKLDVNANVSAGLFIIPAKATYVAN